MNINKKYIALSILIACSVVLTYAFALQISNPEPVYVRENNDNKNEVKPKEVKKKKKKVNKSKNQFDKNDSLDNIVPEPAKGKSPAEVLENVTVQELNEVSGKLKDGTYRGSARGYGGTIVVDVIVENGKIVNISVISHNETPGYASRGFGVINRILQNQTLNVDSVSGATITSNAIKIAAGRALKDAISSDDKEAKEALSVNEEELSSASESLAPRRTPIDYIKYINEKKLEDIFIDLNKVSDGVYEGSATGFNGENKIKLTIKNHEIVDVHIEKMGDDRAYFTKNKEELLIDYIKKDINIKNANSIDTISSATYTTNSLLRAAKKALQAHNSSGVNVVELKDGIEFIRDFDKNKLFFRIPNSLGMVRVYVNNKLIEQSEDNNSQYIEVENIDSQKDIVIKDYKNNILYEGNIDEKTSRPLTNSETSNYLSEYNKPNNVVKKDDIKLKFFNDSLNKFDDVIIKRTDVAEVKKHFDESAETINEVYNISGSDDNTYIEIVDDKFILDEEDKYETYLVDGNNKFKINSFIKNKKLYILAKGNGNVVVTKKIDNRDLLLEQIKAWKNIKYRYFELPPLPTDIFKDGIYYGEGFGYKVDGDKWKSKVQISGGKITSIDILNSPDDADYVPKTENFKNKLKDGRFNDIRKLLSLSVELEKYYAVESSVEHPFGGELPDLDNEKYNAADQREKLKKIDIDTVSGATISTVGIVRSVISALNQSYFAGSNAELKVKSIEIAKFPKLSYVVGDNLELDSMIIKVLYTNSTEKDIEFKDFENEKITVSIENNKVLDNAGKLELTISSGDIDKKLIINVQEKSNKGTYVQDTVGDYESVIFVRPPEIGETLNDGTYIGHGSGYYAWYGDYSIEPSYVRKTIIELKVENGKVVDIRELHFGDDIDGGGIGYKARADKFKGAVFSKVKTNLADFIKLHIDLERYVAYRQRNKFIKPIGNDDSDIINNEVKPRMRQADAVTGATYSSVGYSRAIAEALWKSSKAKNKVLINDMRLEDFDEAYKLDSDPRYKNYFNGLSQDEKRQYRVDNKLHQIYFNDGEKFDPTNLVMTVKYTDGSEKKIPFDKLEENGFKATVYDTDTKKETPLTVDNIMEKTYYRRYIRIEPVEEEYGIQNFITSSIFIK